jgi:hypothetical protein
MGRMRFTAQRLGCFDEVVETTIAASSGNVGPGALYDAMWYPR